MEDILLIGMGGHSLSVMDSIIKEGTYHIAGFIDCLDKKGTTCLSYPWIGEDKDLQKLFDQGISYAFITIGYMGDSKIRSQLYKALKAIGYSIPTIIDPSAVIGTEVVLDEGIYVGKQAVINTKAQVGKLSIINTGAIIEHGCELKEEVHIAPGTVLCGDVRVGAHTFVGANSTVIQGISMGTYTKVGAGSVVCRNLGSNVLAYGNPCKVIGDR